MTPKEMVAFQRENTVNALHSLVMHCRTRYLHAANLLGVHTQMIARLREFGVVERIQLSPLVPTYNVLCERYLEELYSPQLSLLPSIVPQPKDAWLMWFYQEIIPLLLREDECVRNVLRAVDAIPSPNPKDAVEALRLYVAALPLQKQYFRSDWSFFL